MYTGIDRLFISKGLDMIDNLHAEDNLTSFLRENYKVAGVDVKKGNPFGAVVKKENKDELKYEPFDTCIDNLVTLAPILEKAAGV